MESISIEIRENERCPAGLEILLNQSKFTVRLNPKGGVGDFEIINAKGEVVIIGQKHLAMISLLENTSRSEVLTLDLSNIAEMKIACPPTDDIAVITNTNMGLFSPNTLEITGGNGQKQYNFKFQRCKGSPPTRKGSTSTTPAPGEGNGKYTFQVVNDGSVTVTELSMSRLSSKVAINLPGQISLTPVQAAVIFGGLAFQIYSIKKQKSLIALLSTGSFLVLIILIIILYVMLAP